MVGLDDFIFALETICFGSHENFAKFLFDIFDVKKEQKVEKKELFN